MSELSLTTPTAIEQGCGLVSQEDIQRLAQALGMSVGDLLSWAQDRKRHTIYSIVDETYKRILTMLPTSNVELTEEETDELEHFLFQESGLESPMTVSEIDGLLTAVVIGPVFPPPSQWMPLVWGDDEGPEFTDEEQAQRIIGLLMQQMNSLSHQLQQDPDAFEPMLVVDLDEDKQPITIADFWCMGFMAGLSLYADAWQDVELALLPIVMFASEPGNADIDEELEANRSYWIEQLGTSVAEIYRHFQIARSAPVVRAEPKVGRNALCPCGSGKKYKKCCGLH